MRLKFFKGVHTNKRVVKMHQCKYDILYKIEKAYSKNRKEFLLARQEDSYEGIDESERKRVIRGKVKAQKQTDCTSDIEEDEVAKPTTPRFLPRSNLFPTVAAYHEKILYGDADMKLYRRGEIQQHRRYRERDDSWEYNHMVIPNKHIEHEVNSIEKEIGISIFKQKIKFIY